jgi:hypothetical protein
VKALLFAMASVALAASPLTASAAAAPDQQIKGRGCVEAGVDTSCLMVKDVQNGRLYSLQIRGVRPPVGIGIDFAGAPFSGVNTCMQGTPVLVSTWTRNETLQCGTSKSKGKSVQ